MPCSDPNCQCATTGRVPCGRQSVDAGFTLVDSPLPIHAGNVPQAEPNELPAPPYGVEPSEHDSDSCEECFHEDGIRCAGCRDWTDRDNTTEAQGGSIYCSSCYSDRFISCDHCGRETDRDNEYVTEDGESICDRCYSHHYFTCDGCGHVIRDRYYHGNCYCDECAENGNCDCDECSERDMFQDHGDDALGALGFQGNPADGLYLGIELEVQVRDRRDRQYPAEQVLNRIGSDFVILKEDGSLVNGFEIVSAPATRELHQERWARLFDRMPSDLRSWDAVDCDCGMHIHATRAALSALTVGKLLVFLNAADNQSFVQTIAGRKSAEWACMDAHKTFADAKHRNHDRYEALNLTNRNTIEFRIFRGTLNKRSFFKNMEFVYALIEFVKGAGLQGLSHEAFLAFVRRTPKRWPNLSSWLRDKGLIPAPRVNPSSVNSPAAVRQLATINTEV